MSTFRPVLDAAAAACFPTLMPLVHEARSKVQDLRSRLPSLFAVGTTEEQKFAAPAPSAPGIFHDIDNLLGGSTSSSTSAERASS